MPDPDSLRDSALWLYLHDHRALIAPLIAIIAFVESFALAGVAVPGVLLLAAAALAAGGSQVPLWTALGCAFAGAVAGDGTSFLIGRSLGPRLKGVRPLSTHPQWLERGERFFRRHGNVGIVFGRFVGPVRPVMPLMAGSLGFPAGRFALINFASALVWAPVYILPGYLLGASVALEVRPPEGLVPGLVALAIWTWLCGHLIARAWRLGAPSGPLAGGRLESLGLLRPLWPGDRVDSWASVLLGGGAALTLLGVTASVLALADVLMPWRRWLMDMVRLTLSLL